MFLASHIFVTMANFIYVSCWGIIHVRQNSPILSVYFHKVLQPPQQLGYRMFPWFHPIPLQFLPPAWSPAVCYCISEVLLLLKFHVSELMEHLVYACPILHLLMLPSSACGMLYAHVWLSHDLFIHSTINEQLGCFYFWLLRIKASTNICVQVIWMWILKTLKLTDTNYMYLSYTWFFELCTWWNG